MSDYNDIPTRVPVALIEAAQNHDEIRGRATEGFEGSSIDTRAFQVGGYLYEGLGPIQLAPIMEEAKRGRTPLPVKRCVVDVMGKGKSAEDAFAICVASHQKAGNLKPGTMELTAKGKKRSRAMAQDDTNKGKVEKFKQLMDMSEG